MGLVWGKKKGGYIRKVGGVFVYVCGQEVLHGCCVEHDGAGFFELTGVVDAVGGARLRGNEGWRLGCPLGWVALARHQGL